MAIFNSYVKLPEGIYIYMVVSWKGGSILVTRVLQQNGRYVFPFDSKQRDRCFAQKIGELIPDWGTF